MQTEDKDIHAAPREKKKTFPTPRHFKYNKMCIPAKKGGFFMMFPLKPHFLSNKLHSPWMKCNFKAARTSTNMWNILPYFFRKYRANYLSNFSRIPFNACVSFIIWHLKSPACEDQGESSDASNIRK